MKINHFRMISAIVALMALCIVYGGGCSSDSSGNGSDEIKTPETSSYTVKHLLQNVALSGYKLKDTEALSGTTGGTTSAQAKIYTGFTAKPFEQGTIAADGSAIISIYYDRNTITLTFDSDGGSDVDAISGAYGTDVTAPENPTKTGYTFSTWSPKFQKPSQRKIQLTQQSGRLERAQHTQSNTSCSQHHFPQRFPITRSTTQKI